MAAPNIVNVTTIYGRSNVASLTTASANVVINALGSGTVVKINDIYVSNFSASAIAANVVLYRNSVSYFLAPGASVPAYSTLTVVAKDTSLYLEEGDVIQANSSSATAGQVVCSYEIIS